MLNIHNILWCLRRGQKYNSSIELFRQLDYSAADKYIKVLKRNIPEYYFMIIDDCIGHTIIAKPKRGIKWKS